MMRSLERRVFLNMLRYPMFFKDFVRPLLYLRYKDPEVIHEKAFEMLAKHNDLLIKNKSLIDYPENKINIKGKNVMPYGTAAGFDKNCDALCLASWFGYLEVGTIVVPERQGNPQPRVASGRDLNLYNAQGFPSKGLDYSLRNLQTYRETGGEGVIYASICGLPPGDEKDTDKALYVAVKEVERLLYELEPYVDGFVWNPFSPNTAALKQLRTPKTFGQHAKIFRKFCKDKLSLVKMGPYDPEDRDDWMDLAGSWLDGGGDGVVAVNTYMVPKEQVPVKNWGYPSAGKSGKFLIPYMRRAVKETRDNFPQAFIFAAGGIFTGREVYRAFELGANTVQGITPYKFYGLGLLPRIIKETERLIQKEIRFYEDLYK